MKCPRVVRITIERYYAENGPLLAKGLAYNFLLGLLPLIFLVFWTAALLVDLAPGLQLLELLQEEVLTLLPQSLSNIILDQIKYLSQSKGALGTLTSVTFFVTIFFLFESLERIIRTMLGGAGRSWWKARGISAAMVVGSLLFVYASAVLSMGVRIINSFGIFSSRFLPFGVMLLSLVLTSFFFAFCQIIYAGKSFKIVPLLLISFSASGVWQLVNLLSGFLVRSAGRRFIVYGAMAGAVSYSIILRILAEIVVIATLLVRYYALGEKDDPGKKRPPDESGRSPMEEAEMSS